MPEPTEKKSFVLRIDPKLWNDINRMASDELRSVNGQIEYILRDAVKRYKKDSEKDPDEIPEKQ